MTTITDQDCPDCDGPMFRWKDGEHPELGMTPRLRCNQCGRWVWHTLRLITKEGEQ